jgi:hypothetical protein
MLYKFSREVNRWQDRFNYTNSSTHEQIQALIEKYHNFYSSGNIIRFN